MSVSAVIITCLRISKRVPGFVLICDDFTFVSFPAPALRRGKGDRAGTKSIS